MPIVFALIFLTDVLTDGMQSFYGLACAGSQMAHSVLPHLQHIDLYERTPNFIH